MTNLEEVYFQCEADGKIQFRKDIDNYLMDSLINRATENLSVIEELEDMTKKRNIYSIIFTTYYDILRSLIDAYLLKSKIKCSNYQCTNAYLCKTEPGFRGYWEVLEEIRTKRNEILYRGTKVTAQEWSQFKPKIKKIIELLIKA